MAFTRSERFLRVGAVRLRKIETAYASAKGGLKMLTRNIASEYGAYNIQCNGIGPGYIATPQTAPLRERDAEGNRHPFDSFIVAKTPAARWGTPEDLMGLPGFVGVGFCEWTYTLCRWRNIGLYRQTTINFAV